MIENDSRLHPCYSRLGIDFEDPIRVLRTIEDDRDIATLAGK
jgi:hypothetical protein